MYWTFIKAEQILIEMIRFSGAKTRKNIDAIPPLRCAVHGIKSGGTLSSDSGGLVKDDCCFLTHNQVQRLIFTSDQLLFYKTENTRKLRNMLLLCT
jgi:hypothetical protein